MNTFIQKYKKIVQVKISYTKLIEEPYVSDCVHFSI